MELDEHAKATDKGIRLFEEKTGERFYKGANSAYEFYKVSDDIDKEVEDIIKNIEGE